MNRTIEICGWCGEEIAPCDRANGIAPFHRPCLFRAVCGSLAHQQFRCACFVEGSRAGDPPGLSKREAADVAYAYWLAREANVKRIVELRA